MTVLGMRERFTSDRWLIQSESGGCKHTTFWNVIVVNRECEHRHVFHHTHNYREHWRAMYEASERFIVTRPTEGEDKCVICHRPTDPLAYADACGNRVHRACAENASPPTERHDG